jgi:hypothetical protein
LGVTSVALSVALRFRREIILYIPRVTLLLSSFTHRGSYTRTARYSITELSKRVLIGNHRSEPFQASKDSYEAKQTTTHSSPGACIRQGHESEILAPLTSSPGISSVGYSKFELASSSSVCLPTRRTPQPLLRDFKDWTRNYTAVPSAVEQFSVDVRQASREVGALHNRNYTPLAKNQGRPMPPVGLFHTCMKTANSSPVEKSSCDTPAGSNKAE